MKILLLGFAICIIIFAILLLKWFRPIYLQTIANNKKIKKAVFIEEINDLILLKDYEGKEISKKIKLKIK